MAHIHYKFASKRSSDTVIFDGPHMTLQELKRLIMEKEKLRSGDCDLQITNAQTNEEFTDNEGLIAKGSSVVVRRIPVVGARSSSNAKLRNVDRSDGRLPQPFGAIRAMGAQSSSSTLPLFSKMTNLAFVDASEEDKLKVLVNQSLYDPMSYNMKVGPGLPANYSCFRCGSTGHHIRNCPNSGDKTTEAPLRIKKSTGIPRSFMVEVDDPSIKGAMLTNCGHYAIPAIHAKAYAVGKKEKPPFVPQEPPVSKDEDPVPKELLCLICKEMLSDAVVIPCCGNSFCDDCIRTALLDSDQHTCPTCKQSNVSPDTLIANKFLRQAVNTFQKEQGQSKSSSGNDGASQSVNPAWAPDPVLKKRPPQPARKQQTLEPTARGRLAPPLTTGPAPPPAGTGTSPQPLQTQANAFKSEPEEQSCHQAADAAAGVSDSARGETSETVGIRPQQASADPAAGPVWPPAYWESTAPSSSSSSSSCPPSSSLTYPSVPPPLFPPSHFPSFPAAQHHLASYPPGYPNAAPVWSVQPPQGRPIAPIPPLCSSAHDWYKHQRDKNKTRSPHRGSSHRRSSSRSKSSKSSRSSSRSRSRSRSVSRSRHHSPYSRSRHLHTRSHSSYANSSGYQRSPTPSSSSSPRRRHRSRSKSPLDHRKKSHHGRQHSRNSSSGRRAERGPDGRRSEESRGPEQRAKQSSSVELDRQRYLQWEKDYKEWCDKYLSSYVSHFHQLPPLLSLPPSPRRLLEDAKENGRGSSRVDVDSRSHRHCSRSSARPKERSPPPRSSSDCCSTASQSPADGRSSPSQSSNPSRSPASHLSSDGYPTTPSKPRAAERTEDGRKEARRPPRSRRDEAAGPEKTSESAQPMVRGRNQAQREFNRERREHESSEKKKHQDIKEAGKSHSGNSKTDSRSEKPGKRKADDAETRSSKRLTTSPAEACKSESPHLSDKKGSEKERAQPASERDIWEGGMKVKTQKRISINISLDGRKKEEKDGQTRMCCPESAAGRPGEDVQKSDDGGEEKAKEREFSGEPGGDAKEDINPKEEEEEGKGLQEEQDGMKASTNKDVMTVEEKSAKTEGRSGGEEGTEVLTGESTSTETESRVEAKLRMETTEDRTRSLSEQEREEREESGRHGCHGNGLERVAMVGAPEEYSDDRAPEREGGATQMGESVKKEQDEKFKAESSLGSGSKVEKSSVSGPHCGTAPPSGKDRFYSGSSRRGWKREVEMENDRARQREKERKRSQERRKKEENHRDREEEQSERKRKDDQGKSPDSRPHRCSESLPAPSHKCKGKAAGSPPSPPPLHPRGWGEERGPLPSEGVKESPTDVTGEKKARTEKSTDDLINVCRPQGGGARRPSEEEKKGRRRRDVGGAVRREPGPTERPRSPSASRGSSGGNERMKDAKHKKEKGEGAHELLEEREKERKWKKSRDGKEN